MRTVPKSGVSTLSPRQAEIAELLRSGKSSREIGALLCIDPRTVDTHVTAICAKLGVRTRVEIVDVVARSKSDARPGEPAPRRTNLPLQVTSFVGREIEIADITALVRRHRLVTLTGSGGVGKTRTSLEVAADAVDGRSDGVWFIELAPLSSGEYVPTTIAQAVGIKLGVNGDPVDQLVAALKSKNMLLVIDNCEHLIDASARIISALMNSCPLVTILASSRQGLGIVGEVTYRVPSLPVPTTAAGDVRAQSASQFAAVSLFMERATAVNNRFELTDANAPSVVDICRSLDGIALAIELAAAWVKILSPQQLRSRLDERFRLLTGGGRNRLPRHQTLRALIDWSYDLLDEGEQRLFSCLSIFASGFTFEAASAIGGDRVDRAAVLDRIESLVDKSLVMADLNGDVVRYRLLESTRAYAAEKLVGAGESDAAASRHLRYFRDWFVDLRRKHDQLRPGIEVAFVTELDDLRVALDRALVHRELSDGAELLAAIGPGCWISGGLAGEGMARCEVFLAELPSSEPRLLAELAGVLCFILTNTGRLTLARKTAVAAIGYARASQNGPILASALNNYANALLFSRDFPAAACALSEAEAIQGTPPLLRLRLLDCRAILSAEMGDLDSAAHSFAQLREEWRSAGLRDKETVATVQLSDVEFRRRQYEHATALLREAISLARCNKLPGYLPVFLVRLGSVLAVNGEIAESVGPAVEAMVLGSGGEPRHDLLTPAIELLAYIAAAHGDFDRAARLAGYADASVALIGYTRDYAQIAVHQRLTSLLGENVAPDKLTQKLAEGAFLTSETAVALARTLEDIEI
jgi:predicted ATPase/DNA-binding CsgD family transcriptional regulator